MERFTCHQASWQKDWILSVEHEIKKFIEVDGWF
jgi:hypothetical protein